MNRVELLAPAGNLEKLKIAIMYGADAVYIGGYKFSLRARASNFSLADIKEGCCFARLHNAKVYVTMNIIPHDEDFTGLDEYLQEIESYGVNGIIVSSMWIIQRAKVVAPLLEIHISTQTSIANSEAIAAYQQIGAKRVVLARELSFDNIKAIARKTDVEIEVFIHGGMCVAYSGRCMLSNHFTDRDANRGGCAHSCRWNYNLFDKDQLLDQEYLNMGSKDLCAVTYIPGLIAAGVKSLKIEGRMKSSYYIATVVRCYRMIIDSYYRGDAYDDEYFKTEIAKAENRFASTGFLKGEMSLAGQIYNIRTEMPTKEFVGIVVAYDEATSIATIEQRNYFSKGDVLEFFGPHLSNTLFTLDSMFDNDGVEVNVARHPLQLLRMRLPFAVEPFDMIRKV